ncbi:efflux RND transporter periplasmic adaptor subunit [Streptomyces sp. NPDC057838]|uniref:efflux RND transporter periplasmic adaptor subunit n=1 Tax=unclassified Streptomyces TaxID=2593676 RepID=UPI003683FE57
MPKNTLRRRRRALAGSTVAAASLIAVGFAAGSAIRSPQQVAADAAGPGLTTLTTPVERRVLTSTVLLRGDVTASRTVDVTPSSKEAQAIVTAVKAEQGQEIGPGRVILEVSGRPLFALPGGKPAYRDLRPGAEGEDVAQLQAALKKLGHDPGEHGGTFGPGTKNALRALYDAIGYEVPTTGDDQAVSAAQDRVAEAEDALATARGTGARRAGERLERARRDLAQVRARSGPMLPVGEFVFLPSFPARVAATQAVLGAPVKAPLVTLSSGRLEIKGSLNPGQRDLVRKGQTVRILSETTGRSAQGTVTSVGALVQDKDTGASSHPLTVTPAGALDAGFAGTNVQLRIEAAASRGKVLVVPVSALFATSDGTTNVVRVLPSGEQRTVPVTAGMSAGGMVAVTPERGGTLRDGERVVISRPEDDELSPGGAAASTRGTGQ